MALTAWLVSARLASADRLYVSGRVERIAPGRFGGGGGGGWQHAFSDETSLEVGLSAYALAGTNWGTGSLALAHGVRAASINARATVGGSNTDGAFLLVRAAASHPVVTERLRVDVGCDYLGSRSARGSRASAGLTFVPRPVLLVHGAYFRSFTGHLDDALAVVKVAYVAGRGTYQVGGSIGRSTPIVLGLPGGRVSPKTRHVFGGVTLPSGRGTEFLVTLEHYDLETTRRTQLSLAWARTHRP